MEKKSAVAEEIVLEAHCFGCKKKTVVRDPRIVDTSNNRKRLSGKCSACFRSVSNFVKSDSVTSAEASPIPSSSLEAGKEAHQHTGSSLEKTATK